MNQYQYTISKEQNKVQNGINPDNDIQDEQKIQQSKVAYDEKEVNQILISKVQNELQNEINPDNDIQDEPMGQFSNNHDILNDYCNKYLCSWSI